MKKLTRVSVVFALMLTVVLGLCLAACSFGPKEEPKNDTAPSAFSGGGNGTPVAENTEGENPASAAVFPYITHKESDANHQFTVAVAWRADMEDYGFNTVQSIYERLGAKVIVLEPTTHNAMTSQGYTLGSDFVDANGALNDTAANILKTDPLNTTAAQQLEGVDLVICTGGDYVSPSLWATPGQSSPDEYYNALRDVSDYSLMSYCLDQDIPLLGICRGEQMFGVVCGADIIRHIVQYYNQQGLSYPEIHRYEYSSGEPEFVPHDVEITDPSSLMAQMFESNYVSNLPSYHDQAVTNTENGTNLKEVASYTAEGVKIVEGIERTDKLFAAGIQSHPEMSVSKADRNYWNADQYTDPAICMRYFQNIMTYCMGQGGSVAEPANVSYAD